MKEFDIERLREEALDAIPQSLIIADADSPDFPIIYANRAFELLTGYSAQEALGRNCRFLGGADTSVAVRAAIRAALRDRQPYAGRILNYRKDGTAFWNELSLTPMQNQNGDAFFVGVQVDVTERLELEARLRESQRMEALGKLSGGIAHDFNNILALILGNAEIIASESAPGLVSDAAADIIEAAEGGAGLITRLLHYARGEEGTLEKVAVNEAVTDVIALVSRGSGPPVKLETDLSPAVSHVRVDRALFNTSLMNLLINARDAIASRDPSNGTGSIRISTRLRANAGPALGTVAAVKVADDGIGMEPEVVARAFEPFFTTKGEGRGNGLGLAMVYNFVKQAAGEIAIESKVGAGTSVTMLLPIATDEANIAQPAAQALSILLVEDESKVRKMVARQLVRAGYLLEEVASAEEALQLIESDYKPDAVLTDVRLREGMSGAELVLELQRRKCPASMLFMTGFAEELEWYADELKQIPVLRKPFRNTELLAAVEGAMQTKRDQ